MLPISSQLTPDGVVFARSKSVLPTGLSLADAAADRRVVTYISYWRTTFSGFSVIALTVSCESLCGGNMSFERAKQDGRP